MAHAPTAIRRRFFIVLAVWSSMLLCLASEVGSPLVREVGSCISPSCLLRLHLDVAFIVILFASVLS